jgi:hypothetical protein
MERVRLYRQGRRIARDERAPTLSVLIGSYRTGDDDFAPRFDLR